MLSGNNSLVILIVIGVSLIGVTSGADPLPSEAYAYNVGTDNPLCWATILNEEWVVTSAFCAWSYNNPLLRVAVSRASGSIVGYEILEVIYHPLFNANTRANDLALIHLKNAIRLEGDVEPAQLNDQPIRGGVVVTLKDGVYASTITDTDCKTRVGPMLAQLLRDGDLCTLSVMLPGQLSGRGIVWNKDQLIAIPSWTTGQVYVHSRISFYKDWINEVVMK